MNAIETNNITVVYQSKKSDERTALNDFSLAANNQLIALLGPNGSGKSTLLNVLAQTIAPTAGTLVAPTSRTGLSIVFQTPALDELLTVRENLKVSGALHNLTRDEINTRTQSIAQELHITDRLDDQVRHLSGGLARRADLARALIAHPTVLLLDEPTPGLDIDARRIFWQTLHRTRKQLGMTVLIATHITDEAEHADRVVMIRQGRSIKDESPTDLKASLGRRIIRINTANDADTTAASQWLTAQSIEHITCDHLILGREADPALATSCPVESAAITIAPPTLEDAYTYYAQSSFTNQHPGAES